MIIYSVIRVIRRIEALVCIQREHTRYANHTMLTPCIKCCVLFAGSFRISLIGRHGMLFTVDLFFRVEMLVARSFVANQNGNWSSWIDIIMVRR